MVKSKIVYCTYFDKNFIQKGLALHSSLIKHQPDAKLWILAFDNYTKDLLAKMKLKGVTIIPLSKFEDKKLKEIKNTRSRVEYIWTLTPSWVLYVMKKTNARIVTYLDADLYFFSDPRPGVEEINTKSVLAVEHRFPKGREHMADGAGRFNVAFNVFKNDTTGIKCLKRWRDQCIEWCYWRLEDGKLGDQMYLDEWPSLYGAKMVISKNIGVNVAPWNVSQYKISNRGKDVYIDKTKLVCYHFHQFQILGPKNFSRILGYTLSKDVIDKIYKPYEEELMKQFKKVREFDPDFKIKIPKHKGNRMQILRQALAKYIGPAYWRIKGWVKN